MRILETRIFLGPIYGVSHAKSTSRRLSARFAFGGKDRGGWGAVYCCNSNTYLRVSVCVPPSHPIKDDKGRTPLHWAVQLQHPEMIKMMISRLTREDLLTTDENGWTPLHYAAHGKDVDSAETLLACGAIDQPDRNGQSALHLAIMSTDAEMVQMIIERGHADINADDCLGRSAIHLAASVGVPLVCMSLLRAKAQVNIMDADGKTPLFYACQAGYTDAMRTLISAGGDVGALDDQGSSVLHAAALGGSSAMCKYLAEHGKLDINARDLQGMTPLHVAVKEEDARVVGSLIVSGADVGVVDHSGNAPLHFAAASGSIDCITQIMLGLDNRAKNAVNGDGMTPYDIVVHRHPTNNELSTFMRMNGSLDSHQAKLEAASKIKAWWLGYRARFMLAAAWKQAHLPLQLLEDTRGHTMDMNPSPSRSPLQPSTHRTAASPSPTRAHSKSPSRNFLPSHAQQSPTAADIPSRVIPYTPYLPPDPQTQPSSAEERAEPSSPHEPYDDAHSASDRTHAHPTAPYSTPTPTHTSHAHTRRENESASWNFSPRVHEARPTPLHLTNKKSSVSSPKPSPKLARTKPAGARFHGARTDTGKASHDKALHEGETHTSIPMSKYSSLQADKKRRALVRAKVHAAKVIQTWWRDTSVTADWAKIYQYKAQRKIYQRTMRAGEGDMPRRGHGINTHVQADPKFMQAQVQFRSPDLLKFDSPSRTYPPTPYTPPAAHTPDSKTHVNQAPALNPHAAIPAIQNKSTPTKAALKRTTGRFRDPIESIVRPPAPMASSYTAVSECGAPTCVLSALWRHPTIFLSVVHPPACSLPYGVILQYFHLMLLSYARASNGNREGCVDADPEYCFRHVFWNVPLVCCVHMRRSGQMPSRQPLTLRAR